MRSKLLVAATVLASVFMFPASAWAAISFGVFTSFGTGTNPIAVATGDFNGDGAPDVVTANLTVATVSVLLNDGAGALGPPTAVAVGAGPCGVSVGDVNADGDADIVVANRGSDNVSVLLGDGTGSFTQAIGSPFAVGDTPFEVEIGDIDGDGKSDLVVVNFDGGTLTVLNGDGTGNFTQATGSPFPIGSQPRDIALGDFNGDGDLDAVSDAFNFDVAYVALNNGSGGFAAPVTYGVDNAPDEVVTADFNDDGDVDFLTANRGPGNAGTVSLLTGNGDGTFDAAVNLPVGHGLAGLAVGDLDGDGNLDVATVSDLDDVVDILPGTGGGAVGSVITSNVGDSPAHVAINDLDADGKPDLVTSDFTSNTASVLLNQSTPSTFTTGPTATISGTARQGQTLTAGEGTPVPTQDSFAYEWFADGVTIAGESAKTLLLKPAQVGKKISVEVTAIKAGLTDASDTSAATAAVQGIFVPGPKASISGFARVGATLTANAGSPSPTPSILGYRWFANGQQLSPVTKTLKLTTAHRGKRIQVKVFAIKPGYLTATSLSSATAIGVSSLQAKTISMELNDYTVRRGQRVSAEIELLAGGEPFTIVLGGKTLVSGRADAKGIARTAFTIPTNATIGIQTIRANGLFPDRTDPDRITVR